MAGREQYEAINRVAAGMESSAAGMESAAAAWR